MTKTLLNLALAAACLSLVACQDEAEPFVYTIDGDHDHGAHDGHDHGTAEVITATHAVACGCALEEVGVCGNYVEVDGEFIELKGDVGLGVMEFCGQSGLEASLTGSVVDGAFVATSYALTE